jgi:hypothetical protein
MNDAAADPLIERAISWSPTDPATALQGWALRHELHRRPDVPRSVITDLKSKLGPMHPEHLPAVVESATRSFEALLADLDREEPNLQHVRRQTRDVFFNVLEALILVEESSGGTGAGALAPLAADLFNRVIQDVYVFEPAADLAAELERWGQGRTELSDLFCTAVTRLFDGRPRSRRPVHQPDLVEVEEFLPVADFLLQTGPAVSLTPAAFADRLAKHPTWYAKWIPQRFRLTVVPRTRELRLAVVETDAAGKETPSRALDGYDFRLGHPPTDLQTTQLKAGVAALKLPDRIDPARLVLQIKERAAPDWTDLFTRTVEALP